jgi:TonB family protein
MRNISELCRTGLRKYAVRLLPILVFALLVALAMPSRAADERSVRTRVAPVYPEIAKRMRVSGPVRLAVTVDAEGKVLEVKAVSGNRTLAGAAEEAVRKWKFATGAGTSNVEVEVNFNLP